MKLQDLFQLKYGVNRELVHMQECEMSDDFAIPFVSRTSQNLGVSAYVKYEKNSELNPANTISVAASGSVLSSFLQKKPYYSGRDIYILIPKKIMSDVEMLFYCKVLNMNAYKFNYGRQANRTLGGLEVPCFNNFFKFNKTFDLQSYEVDDSPLVPKPSLFNMKFFELGQIFDVSGTKTTKPEVIKDLPNGEFPYVTCKASNNGVESYHNFFTEENNVLTIESAAIGFCSYRDKEFSASDHVEKLKPNFEFNKYIGLYISTLVNKNNFKFNYGRKANQDRIKKIKIPLPITESFDLDLAYMENYVKSLRFSKVL